MLIYYSFVCFVKDDIHAREGGIVTLGTHHTFLYDFCGLVYFLFCTSLTGFSLLSLNVQLCSQSVDSLISFCLISLCVHCMFAAKNNIYLLKLLPNSEHEITDYPKSRCMENVGSKYKL